MPLISHCRSYLFLIIVIVGSLFCASCGEHSSGKTKKTAKRSDTASIVNTAKGNVEDTAGYKVFQSISPQMLPGCKQVTVCLLEDARLTGPAAEIRYYPAYHAAQLIFRTDEEILNPDGPEYKHAVLLTKRSDGTVISRRTLDVACARIDTAYLNEDRSQVLYLFTLDYSTGMGSYNGPISYFVNFADTGMAYYKGENGFAITLKSAWAMRYTNNKLEVWSKMCRPGDGEDFDITTKKCTWNVDSFKSVTVVKKGFWEDEGDSSAGSVKGFFDDFSE